MRSQGRKATEGVVERCMHRADERGDVQRLGLLARGRALGVAPASASSETWEEGCDASVVAVDASDDMASMQCNASGGGASHARLKPSSEPIVSSVAEAGSAGDLGT